MIIINSNTEYNYYIYIAALHVAILHLLAVHVCALPVPASVAELCSSVGQISRSVRCMRHLAALHIAAVQCDCMVLLCMSLFCMSSLLPFMYTLRVGIPLLVRPAPVSYYMYIFLYLGVGQSVFGLHSV